MHIRRLIFLLFVLAIGGYFFYEARGILLAPRLLVLEPRSGATFNTTRIHILGRADPRAVVWVDGRSFTADDAGYFEGMITLDPGYSEIGVLVRDRFNRETRKVVKVVIE